MNLSVEENQVSAAASASALFTADWTLRSFERFERLVHGDSDPSVLRAAGVSEGRIRILYPFDIADFTPILTQLAVDPAAFARLRKSLQPLLGARKNDLETAEQYHWAILCRSPFFGTMMQMDLMLPTSVTAEMAAEMYRVHGGPRASLAKLTLLARTLHMLPALLHLVLNPTFKINIDEELEVIDVDRRPYQQMRGAKSISGSAICAAIEQVLELLESSRMQATTSMRAEK